MSIEASDVDRLTHHPFLSRHSAGTVAKKHLTNDYYDTPDQILRSHNMALRVRFDGEKYIQTLKQKGRESSGGLSVRGEWEWVLPGPEIDLKRVQPEIWPKTVIGELDRLVKVFRTDFDRTTWRLQVSAEGQATAVVEMALDQGAVVAGAARTTLLEVEFELVEGDTDVLIKVSNLLGEIVPLEPDNISKAEKGYRLLDLGAR